MSCTNCTSDSIVSELSCNLDSVVVIYTSCSCFTGLLVAVTDDACKLITRSTGGCQNRNCQGKVTVCRLSDIEAVTFCNSCS